MRKLVITVDFDGTCVEHAYPLVGEELPHAAEALRALAARGHKIVLWTCREDDGHRIDRQHLTAARRWFEERGIPLRSVNDGPFTKRNRKVYADLYVDDRNLEGFPGWRRVLEVVAELEAGRWSCCGDADRPWPPEALPPVRTRRCRRGHGDSCHEHHAPHPPA